MRSIKTITYLMLLLACSATVVAQSSFNTNNIFMGATGQLGYSSAGVPYGAQPEIGYSITEFLDVGLNGNILFSNVDAAFNEGENSYKATTTGVGVFARVYPISPFFIQIQGEQNWSTLNYFIFDTEARELKQKVQSKSLLVGLGYSRHLVGESNAFASVLYDVTKAPNSPYRNFDGKQFLLVRAGFHFYLRPGKKNEWDF